MKTKKIFTFLLAIMVVGLVSAQDNSKEEMKLLFHKKNKENSHIANGGYGSINMGWTQIDSHSAIVMGARFAWVANHHFSLGLAGNGFFSDFNTNSNEDPSEYFLAGGYGGLLFEPIVAPMSPVHVSFPVILGIGGVTASPANGWNDFNYNYNNYYYDNDMYFLVEPGVDVEFNIAKFFRLALEATYRLTDGVNLKYRYLDNSNNEITEIVDKNALNGFNVGVSLKFGWF